jgi:hypothetical protein
VRLRKHLLLCKARGQRQRYRLTHLATAALSSLPHSGGGVSGEGGTKRYVNSGPGTSPETPDPSEKSSTGVLTGSQEQ